MNKKIKKPFPKIAILSFLLFFTFGVKNIFASGGYIQTSPASCASITLDNAGDNFYVNINSPNSTGGYESFPALGCFWNSGNNVHLTQGSGWFTNCSTSWASGDILQCKYNGTNLQAIKNGTVVCEGEVSNNTTGNEYLIWSSSSGTVSNFSDCNAPEPTPTPTTEPTPTPTTEPTPTPTTEPTPTPTGTQNQYTHQICMVPESLNISAMPWGCQFNGQTCDVNATGLPFSTITSVSYTSLDPVSYSVASLDLESLKPLIFTGFRFYTDIKYTATGDSGTALKFNGFSMFTNPYAGEFKPDDFPNGGGIITEVTNRTDYTCSGYLGQTSNLELDYYDLFNDNGDLINNSLLESFEIRDFNSDDNITSSDINQFALCLEYEDNDPTGAINKTDSCNSTAPPIINTCTFDINDPSAFVSCWWNRFKTWMTSVLSVFPTAWNQTIEDFKDWLIPTFTETDQETISDLFTNFTVSIDSNLTSIVSLPLTTIQSITTQTCEPLELPLPFINEELDLPCPRELIETNFSSILTLWDLITSGVIGYWVVVKILASVKSANDPEDDKIEVMDI